MAEKRKRVDLPLAQKVELLKALESPVVSQATVAKKFAVSTSQVSRLVKGKVEILQQFENNGNPNRKRQRAGKNEEVGNALFLWFRQKLSQGARISGPMLKQKAADLAAAEGTDFMPSDGWLSRWKARHNVVFKKEEGERQDSDWSAALDWKRKILPQILDSYSPNDIFNADESGLFFRDFPEKDIRLTNINLKFLPFNTTSVMQPMGMGVIKNWKAHYKSRLNRRMITALDADPEKKAKDVSKSITLLDVLYLAKESWNAVSSQTILNCFRKGGFCKDEAADVFDGDESLVDVSVPENMTPEEFEEFVDMDKDVKIAADHTNAEILEAASDSKRVKVETAEEDSESDDNSAPPPLTLAQKLQMATHLRQYVQESGMQAALPLLRMVEDKVQSEAAQLRKQRTIDSYFK
ncbi:Tigger transposable element-derived protein 3 [Acipenser ruthenus]|uniref:Tigger transposable element-derived protein 3 n=1 Tax=Acipenser ruthenus TaxID=7906 RepID=A0A444U5B7_ACIRT|nr:Tigger transposable element-derived protein 3 [Acipenser ruthenus]